MPPTTTVLHEAAHVVAALALGVQVKKVSLVREGDSLGRVAFSIDTDMPDRAERQIITLLAGLACEMSAFPGIQRGKTTSDVEDAKHLMRDAGWGKSEILAVIEKTQRLVADWRYEIVDLTILLDTKQELTEVEVTTWFQGRLRLRQQDDTATA